MRWYKHWKWQCLLVAPYLPWVFIHYLDFLWLTGQSIGWTKGVAGVAAVVFFLMAFVVFIAGYVVVHENDS